MLEEFGVDQGSVANLTNPSLNKNILKGLTQVTKTYNLKSNFSPSIKYGFVKYS